MKHRLVTLIISLAAVTGAAAQAMFFSSARVGSEPQPAQITAPEPDTTISVSDSLLAVYATPEYDLFDAPMSIPDVFFMPPVFAEYRQPVRLAVGDTVRSGNPAMRWTEDYDVVKKQMMDLQYNLFYNHPELVRYNLSMLPEAPKQYHATIDPSTHTITIVETVTDPAKGLNLETAPVKRRHWIRTFNASLQFSQAYVSPNWYQGGNNNLNALANIYYNVKLNQEFHPNLLFETTAQYKLGMNNAPDDSIHAYNVSEDIFQVNTTFGIKATKRWYYSFTGQFKTQVLNSYKSNTHDLRSSFLSPGELTAGVGMTYNYRTPSKNFTFDASIAPISYNLRTCISDRIDHEQFDIRPERKSVSKFGSSTELKIMWKIAYNISLASRLFAFSDYESFQADWENTLAFEINRFLTTQIYAHARYDTRTPRDPDHNWHKLQLKEIFSIGFAYKFSSI